MSKSKKVSATNDSVGYIYCRCIKRNGKVIYPKHAKCFRIPVKG